VSTRHTIRTTDDEARMLARSLMRASPVASLATLHGGGFPLATLTSVATDVDGSPVVLVSQLSGHTGNLLADPRCCLLFARAGKGDPLAHPRISVMAEAQVVDRNSGDAERIRRRFLARQPKAALYVDFPDFLFIRMQVRSASLNGGFGKAYELGPADVLTDTGGAEALIAAEPGIIAHMNEDHAAAVALYGQVLAKREAGPWRLLGVDPDGFEIGHGTDLARMEFEQRAIGPDDVHRQLVDMARTARIASPQSPAAG
jgi:heme iron utilization protein